MTTEPADREAVFTDAGEWDAMSFAFRVTRQTWSPDEIGRVIDSANQVIQKTRRMLEAWEYGDAAHWDPDAATALRSTTFTAADVFDWYELDADAGIYLNGGRIPSSHFWIGEHGPEVIVHD